MQRTPIEVRAPARAPRRIQPKASVIPWMLVAVLAIGLIGIGVWYLVDYLNPTDTEAMLMDYVSDWERGDFASLPGYFALGGTLVDANAGATFAPEEIAEHLADLSGPATVVVDDLAIGNSDRIATARFVIEPEAGDAIDGVSVWEIVGGAVRQQTISYVIIYGPR